MIGRDARDLLGWLVGLPGLEPGTSSLSEIDGRALCYPTFPLVVLLRKSYKDGVNSLPGLDDDRSAMDGVGQRMRSRSKSGRGHVLEARPARTA
jgi:hypothetical protein